MKSLIHIIYGLIVTGFVVNSFAAVSVNDDTQKAAEKLGALKVTEVQHKEGQAALSKSDLQDVSKTITEAKNAGKISEVKVISWADREYPADDQSASASDVKLAAARADRIKDYLKNNLGVSSVTTYNMAKRPNSLQDLFNTSQSNVKGDLAASGAAPQTDSDKGFMGLKGKASESLLLVYVK